jgi:hypothetical protein
MKELERQRVTRIAMDHAMRLQEDECRPPLVRLLHIKVGTATIVGVAAVAVLSSVAFLH